MKLIRPVTITPALVTANSATNANADYVAGTTYAANVLVTYNNRTWLSLQALNIGHTPGDTASTAWWSNAGPSNRWAMFDSEVNTQTTATGSLSFTVGPITANSIALFAIYAATATITATKDGATVYSRTVDLWDSKMVSGWDEYFFNDVEMRSELALTDLPPVRDMIITVTLGNPGSSVACGMFAAGRLLDVGLEQYGLKREGIDYTNVTFGPFSVVTIGTQRYVRKFSTQALLGNSQLDAITRRLDALASVPLAIIGANGRYDSMLVYGLMSYTLDLALPTYSYVSFDVKGLI